MATDFWVRYTADAKQPWNLPRVVHLHRRAAFAGTWAELQRDLKDGPDQSVQRLLDGQANLHIGKDFASTAMLLADAATSRGEIERLKASWFYRFLFGPDPLLEKLTMMWHDHFATANSKVEDAGLMRRQNDTLRKHAKGKFADLLKESVREPALLLYLDAQTNRKGHANENLARELMELFTMGVGNYSETDVKEAARALTGWSVDNGQFIEIPERHDDGEKTILGTKAKFHGTQLVDLLLKQPATADRLVKKLVRLFFGDKGIPVEAAKQLSEGLRQQDLNIGWAVETILKSKLFFEDANLRTRVLSPVEYVAGSSRALELFDPAPSTLALADWAGRIGQDLFDPPNVGGWPHGRAWISTRSMITRANYVSALIQGTNAGRPTPYDPTVLPKQYGFGTTSKDQKIFHHRLLFGTDPSESITNRVASVKNSLLVEVLFSSPEGQLA